MSTCIGRVFAVFASVAAAAVCLGAEERTNTAFYVRLLHSSTWVVVMKPPQQPGMLNWNEGSGWVVNGARRKLVITNFHVVGADKHVQVFFPYYVNGKALTARKPYVNLIAKGGGSRGRVIAVDRKRDLAAIELQWAPAWVKALPIAAEGAAPGDRVYNLGNPGGNTSLWQFSPSTVLRVQNARIKVKLGANDMSIQGRIIETDDSRARRGQSGSLLVNAHGDLVGVVQSISQRRPQTTLSIDRAEVLEFLRAHGIEPVMASRRTD